MVLSTCTEHHERREFGICDVLWYLLPRRLANHGSLVVIAIQIFTRSSLVCPASLFFLPHSPKVLLVYDSSPLSVIGFTVCKDYVHTSQKQLKIVAHIDCWEILTWICNAQCCAMSHIVSARIWTFMILIRVDLPVNSSQQYIFDLRWHTDGTNADYHIWVVDGRLQKRRDKNSRLCEGCTESRLKELHWLSLLF